MENQRKLFEPNIWKDKPLQLKKYGTGGGLTIISTIYADMTASTDHVGSSVSLIYYCTFSGGWDAFYVAQNAGTLGLPWFGDYAAGSSSLVYCSSTNIKYKGGLGTTTSPGAFEYVANFSPITPDRLDLSPLSRPPQFEFGGSDLTEIRRVDSSSPPKPLKNSCGDYYEGLPEFYVPGFEVSLTYNVSANPNSLIKQYSFTTNSATWNGQAVESGTIGKINASENWETYQGVQIKYWRLTVPMRFRTDGNGWRFAEFDYGYRYLDASGNPTAYVDPVSGVYGPVFLDGSGHLLGGDGSARTSDPVIYPAGTPAGYKVLTPIAWSGAGFPNPFA